MRYSPPHIPMPSEDWSPEPDSVPSAPVFTSLRRILDRELPDPDALPETQLIALLNAIEVELLESRIKVDFLDSLPARAAYGGLLQLMDSPLEFEQASDALIHLDGCDSACESCFQLPYCPTARAILGGDWRVAVDQAGINPSCSALFAGEEAD